VTYNFDDVVAHSQQQVVPYDWRKFLDERLNQVSSARR
jgi:hypothetical protein